MLSLLPYVCLSSLSSFVISSPTSADKDAANGPQNDCLSLLNNLTSIGEDGDTVENSACSNSVNISSIDVICRQDTYVLLKWTSIHALTRFADDLEYLVETRSLNGTSFKPWQNHRRIKGVKHRVNKLSKNTDYEFRLTPYYKSVRLGISKVSPQVTTFSGDGSDKLERISNISVTQLMDDAGHVNALLRWNPLQDLVCEVTVLRSKQGDLKLHVDKVFAENSFLIKGLSYSSKYVVTVLTTVRKSKSRNVTDVFDTPSCRHFHGYNLSKCVPDKPEDLLIYDGCTSFQLTWRKPIVDPEAYHIEFYNGLEDRIFTVPGSDTGYGFEDRGSGEYYSVTMRAVSSAGESQPVFISNQFKCSHRRDISLSVNNEVGLLDVGLMVEDDCRVVMRWKMPTPRPDYYVISVVSNHHQFNYTLDGNEVSLDLENTSRGEVLVFISGFSGGFEISNGYASSNVTCLDNQHASLNISSEISDELWTSRNVVILVVVGVGLISVLLMIIILSAVSGARTWSKQLDLMQPQDSFRKSVKPEHQSKESGKNGYEGIDKLDCGQLIVFDEYEIKREKVTLCQILGEEELGAVLLGKGEFGVVHKAVLLESNGSERFAAVKTLRNKESQEEKRHLEKEMEVMKSVGKHRNIVSLLGCCTQDMMLIFEYCSRGDLRRFLRKTWRITSYAEEALTERSYRDVLEQRAFSNILYEQSVSEKRHLELSMMDLLSFARQIALGMAYLSDNRVVHRDLAARNVLLTEDMTAKIADFGLSRDVYERNIYMKTSTNRLPLRWMALESLQYHIFSTKSDVWSYGILLWEIMTLGGCPYPSLQTSEMYQFLLSGQRMERPKPCTPQVYEIMSSCWDAKPQSRPTFSQLVVEVEKIMENEYNRSYLDLSACQYKGYLDDNCDI